MWAVISTKDRKPNFLVRAAFLACLIFTEFIFCLLSEFFKLLTSFVNLSQLHLLCKAVFFQELLLFWEFVFFWEHSTSAYLCALSRILQAAPFVWHWAILQQILWKRFCGVLSDVRVEGRRVHFKTGALLQADYMCKQVPYESQSDVRGNL